MKIRVYLPRPLFKLTAATQAVMCTPLDKSSATARETTHFGGVFKRVASGQTVAAPAAYLTNVVMSPILRQLPECHLSFTLLTSAFCLPAGSLPCAYTCTRNCDGRIRVHQYVSCKKWREVPTVRTCRQSHSSLSRHSKRYCCFSFSLQPIRHIAV